MIFEERRSGLVRLSDSLKTTLELCARSSRDLLDIAAPYRTNPEAMSEELGLKVAHLSMHEIHSLALSAVLLSCFCLESYVNVLAYYLFHESDLLELIRRGHKTSAGVLLEAIDRMSIRDKWKAIGRLRDNTGFDLSKPPFQDFSVLFKYRDDTVHDKVMPLDSDDRKYQGKFPKWPRPLDLSHAMFGAETYWAMVSEVHRLTGVSASDFQRHYNLSPWNSGDTQVRFSQLARDFSSEFGSRP